ncbi:hypothetical protein GRI89_06770 [Altererythrobacter salegens]|uniref:Uncharacterized protein n=1 Tax=Croceibacterium salegens TaxID=1737568 RepID=A0A6I4SW18_9SPHN|nr:hypothetical protein [Croceibacterium salegens]MXO59240.1 hypothetical protein [Croceibacterium salegens]
MYSQFIFIVALVCLSGSVAYRRGGPPERFAAMVIVGWVAADALYHLVFGFSNFATVDPIHIVLDGAELAAIMWLALRANRVWPMFAAAAQVMCVSGHIAVLIQPEGANRAYWAMTQLPQYIQLAALLAGALAHERRVRLIGRYRSWRYNWT